LSYRDYYDSCSRLIEHFGRDRRVEDLRPIDFERFRAELAERFGVSALTNEVNRIRIVFKYVFDQRLIPQPVQFRQSFDRPSKKLRRRVCNDAGPRMFTREELLTILAALDGEPMDVNGEIINHAQGGTATKDNDAAG
jgi:hypothetical protein